MRLSNRSLSLFLLASGISAISAFVACGGTTTVDPAVAAQDSGATTDGGTTSKDGSVTNPDGGTTTTDDAGLVSTPDKVQCANGSTCASAQVCCIERDGGATCQASGGSCGGLKVTCDEKADCQGGQICCTTADVASQSGGAVCKDSCGQIELGPLGAFDLPQLCKTTAECPAGKPCTNVTCRGQDVSFCGGLPAIAKTALCGN